MGVRPTCTRGERGQDGTDHLAEGDADEASTGGGARGDRDDGEADGEDRRDPGEHAREEVLARETEEEGSLRLVEEVEGDGVEELPTAEGADLLRGEITARSAKKEAARREGGGMKRRGRTVVKPETAVEKAV